MKTRTRKILIRFLLIPVVSLIILVVAATAALYYQQQRLVTLAVTALNKELPGELVVGNSNILSPHSIEAGYPGWFPETFW